MKEKVMIITGTSRGIGKYLSEYYLENGYHVIGCSRGEASISNEKYTHFSLDITIEKDVRSLINAVYNTYNKIDVLVNNAGVLSSNHLLLFPGKTAQNIINTNVMGTFLFCREAAKIMSKANYGRIINIVSVDTPLKLEGTAVYAASKAAIVNFTEIIARELAPYNITVNSIGPSPVKTDLIKGIHEEKFTEMINRQAIKRYTEMKDIVNVIDFYISTSSDFITGQNIYLGGV